MSYTINYWSQRWIEIEQDGDVYLVVMYNGPEGWSEDIVTGEVIAECPTLSAAETFAADFSYLSKLEVVNSVA